MPVPVTGRRARRARRPGAWVGWLFVAPAAVMYAVFVLRPLALTVQYSFYDWNGIGASAWVGLANYTRLFTEPELLATIAHAFELILFFSAIPVLLGLFVAATIRGIAQSGWPWPPVPCCSCPRSSRWSRPASCGAGCCRPPVWRTSCCRRWGWAG
ncbi:carbohydrate ABC transporter permease [Actinoplanes sp. CA-030573]|uniref:carbohydrate ABC transporter permease n=1 Tax=Actinoplanes sp. CA-030573 TaxID=3239898 RepID=UPI003D8DEA00